jgi:hypothetical protein
MSLTRRVSIRKCRCWPLGVESDAGVKLRKANLVVLRKGVVGIDAVGSSVEKLPCGRRVYQVLEEDRAVCNRP